MVNQAYYRNSQEADDRCRTDVPLYINCMGLVYHASPFEIQRTRRDYYLLCMVGGAMSITVDGSAEQQLTEDTFIVVSADTYHEYGMKQGFINYYWLHFTGALAKALVETCAVPLNTVCPMRFDARMRELFEEAFGIFSYAEQRNDVRLCACLLNLLSRLGDKADDVERRRLKTVEYINRHYHEALSVARLAEMEHMSESHYRLLFKRVTGISPKDYVIRQRINAACLYLNQYRMSVGEVCAAVGFSDPLYFSKVFKRVTGVSPSAYASGERYR